jgi:hypothetical protein
MGWAEDLMRADTLLSPDRLDRLDVTPKKLKREPFGVPLEVLKEHVEKQMLLSRAVPRWRVYIRDVKREVKRIKSQRMVNIPSIVLWEEQSQLEVDLDQAETALKVVLGELAAEEIEIARISDPIRE